jgi:EAL domain-containing protein (putative c-di-GMP-specific phosphodiesterase class I)
MAYLRQFRVKELKIDRVFINALDSEGEEGEAIVSAIIVLAHSLHMRVVAEGVETTSQLKKLNDMGCDEIQGFLLGKPLSPQMFEVFLRQEVANKTLPEETAQ